MGVVDAILLLALLAALVWGIVALLRWAGHERRVRHAHWRVRVETHADSADVLLVCEGQESLRVERIESSRLDYADFAAAVATAKEEAQVRADALNQ
ncbi:MAG: hypothetical protein ACR2ML_12710 [Solirubrobacteraceae bacterium]